MDRSDAERVAVLTAPPAPPHASAPSEPRADPRLASALRRRLVEAGYGAESGGAGTGAPPDPWSLATGRPLRDGSPLSTIVALFGSGAPVEAREAEAAFAPFRLDDLVRLGLVEVRDGLAYPRCVIQPGDGLFVASDLPTGNVDRVLGVVPASETLARLTVRRPARRAVDLGTGSGVQALLARHGESVVAIDVNPRALAFAAFNAALNETTRVEGREGSWFAPVADESFDVIACNPPYVISPDAAYTYRDSGLPRDAVSRIVVRDAAARLADGGFATILVNWVHGDSWIEPLRPWVAGTGCDALLLHYATVAPAEYAAQLNAELKARDPRAFDATVSRWLDHYRVEGISRIGMGAVILRRRAGGTPWVRGLDMATGPTCASGDTVLRLFDAADFLESPRGRELLRHAYRLVAGHRVDQTLLHPEDRYVVGPAVFRCLPGIGIEARVDARVLEVILECDGRRALGDLTAASAERRGEAAGPVGAFVGEHVRRLVEHGFMVPVVEDSNKGGGAC